MNLVFHSVNKLLKTHWDFTDKLQKLPVNGILKCIECYLRIVNFLQNIVNVYSFVDNDSNSIIKVL